VKADLKKYKDYTVLFNALEGDNGEYSPTATLFKNGEKTVTLNIERTFEQREQALSFALGAAEATVDAKIVGKKPDFALLVRDN